MDINNYNNMTGVERASWISSLELPVMDAGRNVSFQRMTTDVEDEDPSAKVAGSSVLSFVAGLTGQQKEDVQDSILLAQLVANYEYPDQNANRKAWFLRYNEILSYCGWTTTGDSMKQVGNVNQEFTMDQAALGIISAAVGAAGKPILDIVLTAFDGLINAPAALHLFEASSKNENSGSFQVLPCIATDDGEVMMIRSCLQFTSKETVKKILFWKWSSSSVSLFAAANSVTLNQRVFNEVRAAVIEKIGRSAIDKISNINLG